MARDFHKEQNFEEAVKEAYRAFSSKALPEEVLDLLVQQENKFLSAESSEFDFLMRALQLFLDAQQPPSSSPQPQFGAAAWRALPPAQRWNTAVPPLGGSIPDMVSTTGFFVGLQQVYQTKARADRLTFKSILSNVISEATRSSVPHAAMKMTRTTAADISDESIDIFCRNVFNVRAFSTRTVVAERQAEPAAEALTSAVEDPFEDPVQTPIYWYLALRAADRFQTKHGRWPGEADAQVAGDVDAVWSELEQLAKEYGCVEMPGCLSRDHAAEVVRYGGGELHPISALVGGVAAQEAVKIITHQYVPLNNTFVYNGVAGCGGTYEM
jgi:amyloid beta precursor protein binding protein 1